jgi:hypothetical protein
MIVNAQTELFKKLNPYSMCWPLEDIQLEKYPVAGGQYSDIYKGYIMGKQTVAVKVTVFFDDDMEKPCKVCSLDHVSTIYL